MADAGESTRGLLQERQHRAAEGPVETNGKHQHKQIALSVIGAL